MTEAFSSTLHALTLGASPLVGELASMLLVNGAAEEAVRRMNRETARGLKLAEEILGRQRLRSHPASVHMWMLLPPEWRAGDFEAMARRAGVAVVASDSFLADERQMPPAARVSLNASADEEVLRKGLSILQQIVVSRPHPVLTVV
jgi:DNA-binding transcriptional MocR family regulator